MRPNAALLNHANVEKERLSLKRQRTINLPAPYLRRIWHEPSRTCQVIMATHSPMLMAYPNARLLRLSKYGLETLTVQQTDHYKIMQGFCADPVGFVEAAIAECKVS